jgi:hypothetical protein
LEHRKLHVARAGVYPADRASAAPPVDAVRLPDVIGMYGGREDNMFWRRIPNAATWQI